MLKIETAPLVRRQEMTVCRKRRKKKEEEKEEEEKEAEEKEAQEK